VADVLEASTAFDATLRGLPGHAWAARVRMRPGELRAPAALPLIRLRELEVHHVDLDLGYTFADLDPDTAAWVIDDILMELGRRAEVPAVRLKATDTGLSRELGAGAPLVSGTQADLLAWLSGRSPGTGLSTEGGIDARGAAPPAPYWI
jgi:maleylpyruvate isomerase